MSNRADDRAKMELKTLLESVSSELIRLGPQPIAIACATNKFNDAYDDDYWCAVRIGRFHWEQSQFFASPADDFQGYATVRGRLPVDEGGQGTPRLERQSIEAGRFLLAKLERANWRGLLDSAFGKVSDGCVVALIYSLDQLWLSVTDPRGYSWETLYALSPKGLIEFASAHERMDELIARPNLLLVEDIKTSALTSISEAARQAFCPKLVSVDAANDLSNCLLDAAKDIRAETKDTMLVYLAHADYAKAKYREFSHSYTMMGASFVLRNVFYQDREFQNLKTTPMNEDVRQGRIDRFKFANFPKLAFIVNCLNKNDPRSLFEKAFGVDTFDSENILFIIKDNSLYLIHETKLFSIRGRLKPWNLIPIPGPSIKFLGYVQTGQIDMGSTEMISQLNLEDPSILNCP